MLCEKLDLINLTTVVEKLFKKCKVVNNFTVIDDDLYYFKNVEFDYNNKFTKVNL